MDADSLARSLKLDPECARVFLDGCVALGVVDARARGLVVQTAVPAEDSA